MVVMNSEEVVKQLIKNYGLDEFTQIDDDVDFSVKILHFDLEYLCTIIDPRGIVTAFTGDVSASILSQNLTYLNKLSSSVYAINMYKQLGLFKSIVVPVPLRSRYYLKFKGHPDTPYVNLYNALLEGKITW